ncbi:MAG: T9SS type A sorting domain-containing protein [Bacteroidaceae bacterium]|nr:T9SS type A sorting domain-containing protein [Bacteroidaceae bacterium]
MRKRLLRGALAGFFLMTCANAWALDEVDGCYQIGTAQDLVDFATLVNEGKPEAQAVLTADIDMTGVEWTSISLFRGTFDGQGHSITNFNYTTTGDNQGFFGQIMGATLQNFSIAGTLNAMNGATGTIGYADGGSVIKNVHCGVDVNVENNGHCGGLVGSLRDTWIDGCTYSGTFTIIHEKGDSDGGIAGYSNVGKITNCLFSGKIIVMHAGNNCGGILGYVNNGDFKGLHGNLSIGTVEGGTSGKVAAVLGHCNTSTKKERVTGNFYLEGTSVIGMGGANAVETPAVTEEQLASGEIAYLLNAHNEAPAWFQLLGTDPMPTRTGTAVVYQSGTYNCDGTPATELTYTNTETEPVHTPHNYDENGFCDACGALQQGEDGYYVISNPMALRWVAQQVNAGVSPMNLRIVADLDLGGEDWTPIGNDSHMFAGDVDGGFHTISNMVVNHTEPGAGLFGTVSKGTIKNLLIDETCSVTGVKYAGGLIGHSSGANTVNIIQVGVMCDVTCQGEAAAGLIGNANASSVCNITRCFTTGTITAEKDAACFSGWQGNVGAKITDSWSISPVTGFQAENRYLARYGGLTMTNCYCPFGTQGTHIEEEDVASGKLAFLLNGSSFINPSWFQTIGQDLYPGFDNTRGVVYHAGDGVYASITDEASFKTFAATVVAAEQTFAQEAVATQALLDAYLAETQALAGIADRDAFLEAYVKLMETRKTVEASAAAYQTYKTACEEILAYLEANPVSGELYDVLASYLNDEIEPGEDFANGSFLYIMTSHVLTDEQVAAEQAYVEDLLKQAIAADYVAGSEVTNLLTNPYLDDKFEGWERTYQGSMTPATVEGVMSAAEAWNCTFDMHQTLTGMKNGIYLLQANAAYRAAGDIYNTLHAAQLYLNGNVNYVMMEAEDVITKDAAVDGENCHLTGDAIDYSYIMGEMEGYVPMGPIGCAYAFKGNRYVNYVAVEVTDGNLTVGIKNPGTGLEKDWTGFGQFRLFYLGTTEQANEALDKVLAGYADRAATISAFIHSEAEDYAKYPNFSQALKDELAAAVEAIATATDGAAKMELAGKFSQIFQQIYECRQAYVTMVATAESVYTIIQEMYDQGFIASEDRDPVYADYNAAWDAFITGSASAEDALAIVDKFNSNTLYPPFKDDAYQLSTTRDWTIFAMMVNAGAADINGVLCADLDFTDTPFIPIGWNLVDDGATANDTYPYKGTFDGKGHTISNAVVFKPSAIGVGVFGSIASPAVIRNLRLDSTCAITGNDRAGLVGRSTGSGDVWLENLGNEGTVSANVAAAGILGNANSGNIAHIKNCYTTGAITQASGVDSWKNCAQICGWFGTVGGSVENCWSISTVTGHDGMDQFFTRYGAGNDKVVLINNYSNNGDGKKATIVNLEQVKSGEVTYNLNGGNTESPVWFQTLGEGGDQHPVLDATHLIVFKAEDGTYYNDKENAIVDVNAELGQTVNVYDVQGRLLRSRVPASASLQGMPRGMYILKGQKGVGRTVVK